MVTWMSDALRMSGGGRRDGLCVLELTRGEARPRLRDVEVESKLSPREGEYDDCDVDVDVVEAEDDEDVVETFDWDRSACFLGA